MKKIVLAIICLIFFSNKTYAYSSGFLYMINAMGINTVNVNGLNVNEDIYEKYNLIVYGSPTSVSHNQRWKETTTGIWNEKGSVAIQNELKGEWWILGQDYTGRPVHNEMFPDDYTSGTSPLFWNYRVVKDAEESWNDTSKFQYEIQREYMLNSKLSRFGVTYDLTALDIGLNKARLENYATWGNAGSIYTEKPGEGNVYWAATFSIPPLAKDAKLISKLELPHGNEYTILKDEEVIEIPINFGALIQTNSEYAKAEHIQILESELKINSVTVDIVNDSKTSEIGKEYILTLNKNNYKNQKSVIIEVECNSLMATYFANDLPMYATNKAIIIVNLKNDEISDVKVKNEKNAPTIYNIEVQRITTNSGKEVLTDLYVSKKTNQRFICAGQVIKIKVTTSPDATYVRFDFDGYNSIQTLDELTKRFEWIEPKSRGLKTRYSSLEELEYSYMLPRPMGLEYESETKKVFSAIYVIPYETTQTLHSWNSLREESKDAFKIDESKLFSRKERAYQLVVKASNARHTGTEIYYLDVAERWDELYNRDLSKYVK